MVDSSALLEVLLRTEAAHRVEERIFVQLKRRAASQGKSTRSLVNDLLRQAIASQSRRRPFRLELDGWDAELQPGVDILDRDKLVDLMNGR